MPVFIGTSGWQYHHWRDRFYPAGVAQSRWLEHYADRFATVESNNAFYRLPERRTFEAWQKRTPTDFVMAVKVSRYLTHIKRLANPTEPVERFVARIGGLDDKLGPVLLQLPPTLRADVRRLDEVLSLFPDSVRVAVEPRHASWATDDVRSVLGQYRAALCLVDRKGTLGPTWRTAPWGYVRFHEGRAHPRPCYSKEELADWASRLAATWDAHQDVFVYFNNDPEGCAIRDAIRFADAVREAGLEPTRVPDESEVRVG